MTAQASAATELGLWGVLPYWLFLAFFALVALGASQRRPRSKPLGLLWVGFLVIAIMVGLRDRVGVDWANYLIAWKAAAGSFDRLLQIYGGDIGFYSLTWALQHVGAPFWLLNLICATIFAWGLVRFANLQPAPWVGITVALPYLIIVIAMSGTRQATAIGFVFMALVSFTHRKPWMFLTWIAAASLFHNSAILIAPLAGLSFARTRFQSVLMMVLIGIAGFLVVGARFGEYSQIYIQSAALQSSGTAYRLAMNGLAALFFLSLQRRIPLGEHERTLWRNFSLLALASIALFFIVPSSTALDRLLLYVFPLQVFIFAWLPALLGRTAAERFFITLIVIAYAAAQLYVFLNFGLNRLGFIPYRNYLY